MKKHIYTPDFFKSLINRDDQKQQPILDTEVQREVYNSDLEAFFSFLFSSFSR